MAGVLLPVGSPTGHLLSSFQDTAVSWGPAQDSCNHCPQLDEGRKDCMWVAVPITYLVPSYAPDMILSVLSLQPGGSGWGAAPTVSCVTDEDEKAQRG